MVEDKTPACVLESETNRDGEECGERADIGGGETLKPRELTEGVSGRRG